MNVTHIIFDESTFGITQRSLKMLRDKLAEAISHRIIVIELSTSDLCCGYLILDWEWQSATYTGDGFRMDRGGEGGAGYNTAEILFRLFGIRPCGCEEILDVNDLYQGNKESFEKKLLTLAQKLADSLPDSEFQRPIDSRPEYIR